MSEQVSSGDRVLGNIRTALTKAGSPGAQTSDQLHERWAPHSKVDYERTGSLSRSERLELFVDRLREYDTEVHRCKNKAAITEALQGVFARRGVNSIALPAAFPFELLPLSTSQTDTNAGPVLWMRDEPPLTNTQLNEVDGVLTLATVGVAVSGSIALQHGPMEGRRVLTLLPDFHVCIIRSEQVVETLPEGLDRLHLTAARTTTFFSGPSATADIEMTRIKGVHGPRFLCVLLLDESDSQ
jgi:L-lactate dehydrogenase complex protein LldG